MAVQVYNPKKVKVYIDGKEITGFSPDSKLSIVPGGEGTNKQIGTDGEVVWSIDVDDTFNIELTLLQSSQSNDYLSNMYKNFKENGVTRRIMIKDLMGSTVFSASQCCPQKQNSKKQLLQENGLCLLVLLKILISVEQIKITQTYLS